MDQSTRNAGSPLILKVLSGVHLGAEVELTGEALTIGRDPTCDIILEDRLLAEKHLEITRQEAQVQMRVLALPAALDGKSLETGTYSVPPYIVFTIGSTHLAYGGRDTAWPTLRFPASLPQAPAAVAVSPTTQPPHSGASWVIWSAAAGLILFFGGALLALLHWLHLTDAQTQDNTAELAAVRAVLKEHAQANNLDAKQDGPVIQVYGRVANDEDSADIHHAVNYLELPVTYKITSQESLVNQGRSLISLHDLGLTLNADGLNAVVLTGFAPSSTVTQDLLRNLHTLLPDNVQLRSEVVVGDETAVQLFKKLREYSLATYLQLTVTSSNITLAGLVPNRQAADWQNFQNDWHKLPSAQYLNLSQVLLADDSHLEQQIFGAPISALHAGDISWVRLSDNRLLHLGATLGNGWVLDQVSPTSVRLRHPDAILQLSLASP
jgi:type III secretion system YscD/HrpQ family protein